MHFLVLSINCFVFFLQSLYSWLAGLGYSHEDYQLTTLLPRCPLTDRGQTLTQVGLVSDTTLAVDERD